MTAPAADVLAAMEGASLDLAAWALAWAKLAPAIAIVPAFGLRTLPPAARGFLALGFAAAVSPALRPTLEDGSFPLMMGKALLDGFLIAVGAAVPLWAATLVGVTIDVLRGGQEDTSSPAVAGRTTSLGVLFSLLAAVAFLESGGPARVVEAVTARAPTTSPVLRAVMHLTSGIQIAVALAAPLIAASILIEVAAALVARAAYPAQVHATLAPIRSVALLVLCGLFLDRIGALLVLLTAQGPG